MTLGDIVESLAMLIQGGERGEGREEDDDGIYHRRADKKRSREEMRVREDEETIAREILNLAVADFDDRREGDKEEDEAEDDEEDESTINPTNTATEEERRPLSLQTSSVVTRLRARRFALCWLFSMTGCSRCELNTLFLSDQQRDDDFYVCDAISEEADLILAVKEEEEEGSAADVNDDGDVDVARGGGGRVDMIPTLFSCRRFILF